MFFVLTGSVESSSADAMTWRRAFDGIDERRRAADRNGFFERSDLQIDVHQRGEARGQDDAFALDRVEPGERKGDRVSARHQVDDVESSLVVAHRAARLFDQR